MSAAELFTYDRARLRLVTEADSTGYVGTLEHPAQACRVVFLAAELDAIRWDVSRWPELEFGVWCDEPATQPTQQRRRRALNDDVSTELSTWLQLRRSWPQLGGPSIPWPLPTCPPGPAGYNERLAALVATAVEALNTTYRRTMLMAQTLAGPSRVDRPVPSHAADGVSMQASTATMPAVALHATPQSAVPSYAAATPSMQSVADPITRTFVATAVASESEVGSVLAMLVRDAEANAMRGHPAGNPPALHLNHTVLPLPINGNHGPSGNGHPTRFLVTLTATLDPRRHS